jgi:nucleoside-diphosphate-sugar epimerase
MKSALVGFSGFVGGNLLRKHDFDDLYNSQNADQMAGERYDLLVIAAAPAVKWVANQNPDSDRATIEALIDSLTQVSAMRAVLISTVDVYPVPVLVDESSPIDRESQQPYGRHRLVLEDAFRARYERALVLRLPGLFGPGLKKNAIFDLMNDNEVDKIDPEATYQFYDVRRLWDDIRRCEAAGLGLVNVATQPVSMRSVGRDVFGIDLADRDTQAHAFYDFRTRYDRVLGGQNGYLYSLDGVLRDLKDYVRAEG